MNIRLLFIGKSTEITPREHELSRRIDFRVKFELVPLSPAGIRDSKKAKKIESDRFLNKICDRDFVVIFDERGRDFDSPGFSKFCKKHLVDHGKITFIIGGADGLGEGITARADAQICLGKMTWTHHLARLMAIEQIYRALEIDHGSNFHK